TFNELSYNSVDKSIEVQPGASISGSVDISLDNTGPGSAVYVIGATPNWGTHSTSYWEIGKFTTGTGTDTVDIDVIAPDIEGTYYLIIAGGWEFNAGQVISGTNWGVGTLQWDDGNDVAGWDSTQITDARSEGLAIGQVDTTGGRGNYYFPADALKITVSSSAIVPPTGLTNLYVTQTDISFSEYTPNKYIWIDYTIHNAGDEDEYNVEYILFDDMNNNDIPESSEILADGSLGSIPANDAGTRSRQWYAQDGHKICLLVDNEDKVPESNENDNYASRAFGAITNSSSVITFHDNSYSPSSSVVVTALIFDQFGPILPQPDASISFSVLDSSSTVIASGDFIKTEIEYIAEFTAPVNVGAYTVETIATINSDTHILFSSFFVNNVPGAKGMNMEIMNDYDIFYIYSNPDAKEAISYVAYLTTDEGTPIEGVEVKAKVHKGSELDSEWETTTNDLGMAPFSWNPNDSSSKGDYKIEFTASKPTYEDVTKSKQFKIKSVNINLDCYLNDNGVGYSPPLLTNGHDFEDDRFVNVGEKIDVYCKVKPDFNMKQLKAIFFPSSWYWSDSGFTMDFGTVYRGFSSSKTINGVEVVNGLPLPPDNIGPSVFSEEAWTRGYKGYITMRDMYTVYSSVGVYLSFMDDNGVRHNVFAGIHEPKSTSDHTIFPIADSGSEDTGSWGRAFMFGLSYFVEMAGSATSLGNLLGAPYAKIGSVPINAVSKTLTAYGIMSYSHTETSAGSLDFIKQCLSLIGTASTKIGSHFLSITGSIATLPLSFPLYMTTIAVGFLFDITKNVLEMAVNSLMYTGYQSWNNNIGTTPILWESYRNMINACDDAYANRNDLIINYKTEDWRDWKYDYHYQLDVNLGNPSNRAKKLTTTVLKLDDDGFIMDDSSYDNIRNLAPGADVSYSFKSSTWCKDSWILKVKEEVAGIETIHKTIANGVGIKGIFFKNAEDEIDTAFVPGETVQVYARIDNQKDADVQIKPLCYIGDVFDLQAVPSYTMTIAKGVDNYFIGNYVIPTNAGITTPEDMYASLILNKPGTTNTYDESYSEYHYTMYPNGLSASSDVYSSNSAHFSTHVTDSFGSEVNDANVFVDIYRPDNSTETITLSSIGNSDYTGIYYNDDVPGTYYCDVIVNRTGMRNTTEELSFSIIPNQNASILLDTTSPIALEIDDIYYINGTLLNEGNKSFDNVTIRISPPKNAKLVNETHRAQYIGILALNESKNFSFEFTSADSCSGYFLVSMISENQTLAINQTYCQVVVQEHNLNSSIMNPILNCLYGGNISTTLSLINFGDFNETITMSVEDSKSWNVSFSETISYVDSYERKEIGIVFTPPTNPANITNFTIITQYAGKEIKHVVHVSMVNGYPLIVASPSSHRIYNASLEEYNLKFNLNNVGDKISNEVSISIGQIISESGDVLILNITDITQNFTVDVKGEKLIYANLTLSEENIAGNYTGLINISEENIIWKSVSLIVTLNESSFPILEDGITDNATDNVDDIDDSDAYSQSSHTYIGITLLAVVVATLIAMTYQEKRQPNTRKVQKRGQRPPPET
ncbi:MAG: hypothetical protein KAJ33_05510, partial [Thermoplasmata archaeon]|nr:hypothetical protein [Thermoplasmata archaeon]